MFVLTTKSHQYLRVKYSYILYAENSRDFSLVNLLSFQAK